MSPSSVVLVDRANHFTDEYFSVLTDRRFRVRRVTTLEEALASLTEGRDEAPEVLLLNGSGRPVPETASDLARLREADPNLPILVLTLTPDPVLAGRVCALGAAGVLAAPWLPREVVAALERAKALRDRRRESARTRASSLEVTAVRLEAEARRAADLERANARLAQELTAARDANARIGETLKALEGRKAALETRLAQVRAVAELSGSLVGSRDGATIAEMVVREAARLLGADGAALRLLAEDGDVLQARFVLGAALDDAAPLKRGDGVQGWVATTGRPVAVADASRDPRVLPVERAGENGERIACVPVAVRDRVLGTLMLNRTGRRGPFSGADLDLLTMLADQAAVALEQARQAEALERSYLASMSGLVRRAEAANPATIDHSENVAFFALRLARAVGLEHARQTVVRRAALLHDVGRALISPAIVGKAGRLTPDEWAVMRDHPALGYRLIEGVAFLGDARAVVRDHHERLDGAGYPGGLEGQALSLETRIISIAEAFDSMTRDRQYRPALSVEAAAAELRAHRRTQFDPELVDRFVDLLHREDGDQAGQAPLAGGVVSAPAGGGRAA